MAKAAPKGKKRLILLDAHAILHRAYHALPDFSTAKGVPTGALYGLSTMLIKIIEDLKPDYIVACYDVKGPTFRDEIYKEYKAGRQKADEALVAQMKSSRDIFAGLNIPVYEKTGFEADDILGTIVDELKGRKDSLEVIVASGDMDTLQLVDDDKVKVYTLRKGIKDTIMYDEKAVLTRFGFGPKLIPDYKGLRGDPSDNIIGVKGIGDKTATILISTFGTIENIYKELKAGHEDKFIKAGITPRIVQLLKDNQEEAEFSKMLATIRRDAPIKFEFPKKTFAESVDMKKARALFHDLEFRTMVQKLESAVSGEKTAQALKETAAKNSTVTSASAGTRGKRRAAQEEESEDGGERPRSKTDSGQSALFDRVPKDELEAVAVALWLVDSNITNPGLDDIMNFTGAETFEDAKKAIFAELDKRDQRKIYEDIEKPLIPITHAMEERGIKVDREVLAGLGKTYHKELDRLEKSIWKEAGTEFNINSPKQLGDILFDKLGLTAKNMKKTSGGARSTRESELEKLRDLHPIVPHIFEYRELSKLLGTYIDAIPPQLDKNDRLHTDFITAGSSTGRMASQNPNLQNIPIKTELGKAIRKAFIAEKGFVLAGFDYSQMELRIAAFMSGDEKMIDIFRKGEDVHSSVAAYVFNVDPKTVTHDQRRQAKVINFGIIYGMGVNALRQNLGTTREQAQKFMNDYFKTFSTLASYLDKIKAETARKGYTETLFGRRRYFEGINSKIPYIKAQAERMAINAPFQGTGADIIKIAMINIDKYIEEHKLRNDVFALLQVHDELIYEVRKEKAEEIAPKIEKMMESVVPLKDTSGIVLKATASTAANWGAFKEH